MNAIAPDFRLYHSNSLQVLAGLLADELKRPASADDWLAADTILIPQAAMKRWLQAELAQAHGIAANLEFLAPGEFVARALHANLGGEDAFDAAALHWRLYAALRDKAFMRRAPMRKLQAWLAGDDPLKAWSLAAELAGVFEKYQAWRRDWLLHWEAGGERDDAQAELWRRVAAGQRHRARRVDDYLQRFGGDGAQVPQGLPARLFVFATLNVSPDVLRVIASHARAGATHFYLPSPSADYWGDVQTLKEQLRAGIDPFAAAQGDNPLLRDWGAAGRDFMAVLGAHEIVRPRGEVDAHAPPADERLLHRLQADVFHRRAAPAAPLRAAIDLGDNSLQLHACHTRQREVQVLHDNLRALLEDTRFQPPLQARDIVVLAPDIDPYLPAIEAVFGAQRGQPGFIPYTVADASPLASEPVAELFLRLLRLPLSRFGLHETLDLLAHPALGGGRGPDARQLDALRHWLQQAGARWGLDAAHRAQHAAPEDGQGTWKFAIERLLLGHATGADEDIAGVAPWPQLEGSALDALDGVLRWLRVLAQQQKALGQPATAMQWQARLQRLLQAVFGDEEARRGEADARALKRVRDHVQAFAAAAAAAGFEGEVPPEAMRAHFAAVLGEADTRAPLMSGGVGFGRMVPLRLLPFRVICVLGMNDGEYPRRDPAGGLSRLVDALQDGRRVPGDRSLREDDRYLFLQLFCAAQDVFYLSYLGADPRDGSVREPSPLLAELMDAAALHHADASEFRKRFAVSHPLQPFSADNFGDAREPRRFSYATHWHDAACALHGERVALSRWATALPASSDGEVVELKALRDFLRNPSAAFLRQRMQLAVADEVEAHEDTEALLLPSHGLESHALKQAVFQALVDGRDETAMAAHLRARALLPAGEVGELGLRKLLGEVRPYAHAFLHWRGDAAAQSVVREVRIGSWLLRGRLDEVYPHGIARLRIGKRNGPSVIRHFLDRLFASAAGMALPMVEFVEGEDGGALAPQVFEPLPQATAIEILQRLLDMRAKGLDEPLPFAPYSGWTHYRKSERPEIALEEARKQWQGGGEGSFAEGADAALRLALRGGMPFEDSNATDAFVRCSHALFTALFAGGTTAGAQA